MRFGWLDLVDDEEVLRALLTAVEDFGRRHGMKEIIGPLGFTDMDPEGMLIKGFEELGTMATIYNYSYYPQLMEKMEGYEKDNDYVEYKLYVPKEGVPEKFRRVAELTMARYNLHVTKITKKDVFGPRQYGQRVFNVINRTFENLYGYSQMTQRQIDEYIKRYFNFLDFELLCLVEDWNTPDHDLVGVGITIPSLTKALQKCHNGRLFPFGWWHLIRALKFKKTDVVDCLLIGVLPETLSPSTRNMASSGVRPTWRWRPTGKCRASGPIWRTNCTNAAAAIRKHFSTSPNSLYYESTSKYHHGQHQRPACYGESLPTARGTAGAI